MLESRLSRIAVDGPDPIRSFRDGGRGIQPGKILLVQHAADCSGSAVSGRLTAAGFLSAGHRVEVAFGYFGPCVDKYRELGCGVHVVEHKNWLRGGTAVRSARRIASEIASSQRFVRLIRDLRPDLVYVNSVVSLAGVIAAKRLKLPIVWHIRELFQDVGGEMQVPPLGGRRLVRSLLKLSDRRICISDAVVTNILGASDSNAIIIPNAVDDDAFQFSGNMETCRRTFALPCGVPLVGVPGTLRPMKGHPYFFNVAAKVAADLPDCHFAVTGEGESGYSSTLHEQVRRLGLADRVHFLGTVDDMRAFYQSCDAICIPSRAEPFGRTVIESFAAGVPVVASAVGGMKETIEDGETGLLTPYGDVGALTDRIVALLRDQSLRQRLAYNARLKAEDNYRQATYQARVLNVVHSLLESCTSNGHA